MRDKWDHLFDEPTAEDVENVYTKPTGGYHAVSIEYQYGSLTTHHDIRAREPWKRQNTQRSGPVRIRRACTRCGKAFGSVRKTATCSKPCYQALYRERMKP